MVKINGKEVEWKDPPKGYYITDVKQHVIWKDETTEAMMVLLKVPKGSVHELPHKHPHASQWAFGLSGEMQEPDGTRISVAEHGHFFGHTPKGEVHGGDPRTKYLTDIIGLLYWDGARDVMNVE
jgi:hypothetical protein